MDRKRRLALIFATVGVALGAGHIVQSDATRTPQVTAAVLVPTQIVPVSAGPANKGAPAPATKAALTEVSDPKPKPLPVTPVVLTDVKTMPPAPVPAQTVVQACPVSLDLRAQAGAMIGVDFTAPCAPDTRVVLRHAGLAITGKTSMTGTVSLMLPALDMAGDVSVTVKGASAVTRSIDVPELSALRRFAVQWQSEDAFQLHAFENGAAFGGAGHISAAAQQGQPDGGFLTLLGDAKVSLPMMAEIYTFPATGTPDIVVEAEVTAKTCGRELLGETLTSVQGSVTAMELTVATPDCTAIGDILVLNNLVADPTMIAAR